MITELSPIVCRSIGNSGDGIVGFTIQYRDMKIENRMYPFTAKTKKDALKRIRSEYVVIEHQRESGSSMNLNEAFLSDSTLAHKTRSHRRKS